MEKTKKVISVSIICVIVAIIVIICMLVINNKDVNNQANNEIQEEDESLWDEGLTYEQNDNDFGVLNDPNIFYSVNNALESFYYDVDEIPSEEDQINILLQLLDDEYISKNKITAENIFEYVDDIDYDYTIIPVEMLVKYGDSINMYIVNVYIENSDTYELENRYFIIRVDNANSSFSVEPVLDSVENIDDISAEENNSEIESNDYNFYGIETISTETLVNKYLEHFTNLMVKHPDIVYENYLDEDYKNAKFGSLTAFKEYVEENKEEIESASVETYSLEAGDTGIQKYLITDQYENTYIFYEHHTMSYTVSIE